MTLRETANLIELISREHSSQIDGECVRLALEELEGMARSHERLEKRVAALELRLVQVEFREGRGPMAT